METKFINVNMKRRYMFDKISLSLRIYMFMYIFFETRLFICSKHFIFIYLEYDPSYKTLNLERAILTTS